ncbi:hypothetical protein [Streptomyces sp. 351MFTsu5.1]|uniref:hypothetical protein n=1 Tax=Streptomyces sp. 351MFTsu5.1 TaxID=1172180 RepID=UPI0003665E97|nr:hypothetical protein [Streptomyces sp. 351MFTsu5.1]
MRPLVSRGLLLPPLVCAALILGPVGTAAAVTDAGRAASNPGVSQPVAPSDQATLVDRLDALDRAEHGTVLAPLLDAVTDVTALDATTLDADSVATHAKAVAAASARVQQELRRLSATDRSAVAAADPVSDLLASLQSTVDDLLGSLTSLDLGGILSAVTGLLGDVLGAVTGLLGGGLPSLPALPEVPALPELPAT